ncbi:MAG: phosphatase PAP2 family protein [Verrucomicrobia bacterium]|nr:phosphatase PAP2 family protein [Verrucomicrobiota bacterium]
MKHYTFIDYATQGYLALVGGIILAWHSPRMANWPWLLLAHGAALALVQALILGHARWPANRPLDFLRHFYPILLYTGLYHETGLLNQMLYTGYLDPHFLRLEKWLFGWQPGLELMERFPSRLAAEVLYGAYFSYYLMIAGVGLALLVRDRRQFAHFISVVSFLFYACYLIYIFTPVVGPRILCRGIVDQALPPDVVPAAMITTPASVEAGFFFQVMAWIYERFETPGAAFPSSHVAVALCTVYFSFRYLRPIRWVHLAVAALLCVSTVYGRYHYVVDVVAGMATVAVLLPLGNKLYFKFGKRNRGSRDDRTTDH